MKTGSLVQELRAFQAGDASSNLAGDTATYAEPLRASGPLRSEKDRSGHPASPQHHRAEGKKTARSGVPAVDWDVRPWRGRGSIRQRFEAKAIPEPTSGCWLWSGFVHPTTGYGYLNVAGRPDLAHRISYAMHVGPIPEGLCIDHRCRNRACVRPDHLEVVTYSENILRGHHSATDQVIRDYFRCGHPKTPEHKVSWGDRCRACYAAWVRAARPPKRKQRAEATR